MATYTIKQSGGDFSSINAFIADGATVATDIGSIEGTWSVDDTTSVTWNKAVVIVADSSSKQSGRPWRSGDTTYRHREASGHAFTCTAAIDITGINIQSDSTGTSDELFRATTPADSTFTNCQLGFTGNTDQQDIYYLDTTETITLTFEQCFFYDAGRSVINQSNASGAFTNTVNFNSCGSLNISANGGKGDGSWFGYANTNTGTTVTINAQNCLLTTADTYIFGGTSSNPVYTINATYCVSETSSLNLAASEDTQTLTGTEFSYTWVDAVTAAGSEVGMVDITGPDYDPALIDDDTDNEAMSFHSTRTESGLEIPATDIAGQSRDITTPSFDVGPYARTLAAAAAANPALTMAPYRAA